jgi:hypothetical protein
MNENKVFESGAVRSGDVADLAYSLITPIGLAEVAKATNRICWMNSYTETLLNEALDNKVKFLKNNNVDFLSNSALLIMAAIQNEDMALSEHKIEVTYLTNHNRFRYDKIPYEGLKEVARTYREGEIKYGKYNWEQGMDILDLQDHSIDHIFRYMNGDRKENHLGHAAWGDLASIHSFFKWPHLNELLRCGDCDLSEGILKYLRKNK